ncbi:putative FBD-associated F-box protein At5g56690 isoform X2 [Dioscorea cayenensis subsp. rotundata]|uniref:FBD-associated F-box protein At5g56690 isoform X2 n=1 Tax=Dioscorea cayennensis subsp. rotundata TaxID=55577 RepID=A0AB40AT54_DIOCR|nr:putative FBD-associated F-box protein At5g56690 isoform X2 [Dioscorea cayenensis subsp. rotundata]
MCHHMVNLRILQGYLDYFTTVRSLGTLDKLSDQEVWTDSEVVICLKIEKMTSEGSDIISYLPYEIKELILERLPIKDVVRTSVLSSKWRYVWASMRKLVFDDKDFITDEDFDNMFAEFVDRFLLLHDGLIQKFHLMMEFELSETIDRWILVVSRKKVQNLKLVLSGPLDDMYKTHSSLFSCHELRHLCLENCSVILPRNFKGLGKLKTLKLHDIDISDDDLIYLVSSCTQLQQLELIWSENGNILDIEGKEGQKLTISEFSSISISANSNPIDEDMNLTIGSACVPTNLLASQFIVHMKVCDGVLIIPQNFQGLDKLETLDLNNVMLSPDDLENLILGCTQLNEFSASTVYGPDELKIHSNSLRCLKIENFKHIHLVAPLLHDASFNLLCFEDNCKDDTIYRKFIERNLELLEAMEDLYTILTPTSTFDHLVNLSLTVKFGDLLSEFALFCFVEKPKAIQSLKIKAISSREDLPNIWRFAILRDSEIIFDQLLMKMTIVPVEGQLQKSTRTYRKLLKSKTLSSEAAITFV